MPTQTASIRQENAMARLLCSAGPADHCMSAVAVDNAAAAAGGGGGPYQLYASETAPP